jgi:Mg-chelatase subunit ChlD
VKRASCFDVPAYHEQLWDEQLETNALAEVVIERGENALAGFDRFAAEVFHRCYAEYPNEIPAERRDRAAAVRSRLHTLASELPELDSLRERTIHDPFLAGLATAAVAEIVGQGLSLHTGAADNPDADKAIEILDGLRAMKDMGIPVDDDIAAAEGTARGATWATAADAGRLDETSVRVLFRKGVEKAHAVIDQVQSVFDTFGGDSTSWRGSMSPGVALELGKRVRNSAKLQEIMAMAGRLIATSRAVRATKSDYARSEVVGVEQTGDVGRLLPSELACLADPHLTTDLVRRVLDKTALGFQIRGKDRTVKGPIIVCLDRSSSMNEAHKDTWSAAVALAMLDIARHERRAFGVCLFNGDVGATYMAPRPEKLDPLQLLDVLMTAPSGGTDFAPPLDWAHGQISVAKNQRTFARADVVLITDGQALADEAKRVRSAFERVGAKTFGIGIGYDVRPSGLKAWCDEVSVIDDVSRDTKATELVFNI